MCVAIESLITPHKNNQKYQAQYDPDCKKFETSLDETLAQATDALRSKKLSCAEA